MNLFHRSVFLTDQQAVDACPRDLRVKAIRGNAILWFLPYRRGSGVIEIPTKHQEESCEAIVIHDNTGHGLAPGVKVAATRLAGLYFDVKGDDGREHRVCTMPKHGLIVVDTAFCPERELQEAFSV